MKMVMKNCIKPGDVIRVEFGDFDNFVTGRVLTNEPADDGTAGWYRTVIALDGGGELEMYGMATNCIELIEYDTLEGRILQCCGAE